MVHGASAAQALFHAGLIDEIVIHLVPLLLGRGRRLFDDPAAQTRGLRLISSRRGRRSAAPAIPRVGLRIVAGQNEGEDR